MGATARFGFLVMRANLAPPVRREKHLGTARRERQERCGVLFDL